MDTSSCYVMTVSPYLESQQVVHGADDNIDGGRVPRLSSQEVLEI